jgi:hypothetical protein
VISILNPADPVGLDHPRSTLLTSDADTSAPRSYQILPDVQMSVKPSLFITDDPDVPPKEWSEWPTTQVAPGELLEYSIYVGHTDVIDPNTRKPVGNDWYRFAILAFLDHRQVPVQDGGELVFYGQVFKDTTGRIPASVRVTEEPGQHNLLVLLIENPGLVLSSAVKGPTEPGPPTLLPWFIDAVDVAIQVK